MTDVERVRKFNPDYLLKEGYNYYMVKGRERVYIHKRTFNVVKKRYLVK